MLAVELQNEDGTELDGERTKKFGGALRDAGVITGKMSHVMVGSEPVFTLAPSLDFNGGTSRSNSRCFCDCVAGYKLS